MAMRMCCNIDAYDLGAEEIITATSTFSTLDEDLSKKDDPFTHQLKGEKCEMIEFVDVGDVDSFDPAKALVQFIFTIPKCPYLEMSEEMQNQLRDNVKEGITEASRGLCDNTRTTVELTPVGWALVRVDAIVKPNAYVAASKVGEVISSVDGKKTIMKSVQDVDGIKDLRKASNDNTPDEVSDMFIRFAEDPPVFKNEAEAEATLKKLAEILKGSPDVYLYVHGHVTARPSQLAANEMALGIQQCKVVFLKLLEMGVKNVIACEAMACDRDVARVEFGGIQERYKEEAKRVQAAQEKLWGFRRLLKEMAEDKATRSARADNARQEKNQETEYDVEAEVRHKEEQLRQRNAAAYRTCQIVFKERKGREITVTFGFGLGLGFCFGNEIPLTVSRVNAGGSAERLGVKKTWEIVSVRGTPLSGKSFEEASAIVKETALFLGLKDPK